MPLRVINSLSVLVWNSSAQTKRRFEGGEAFTSDLFHKHTSKNHVLAAAAGPPVVPVTETVSLGDFGASPDQVRGLYVQSDVNIELDIDFGAGVQTIPVVRPGPVGTPAQLYLDGSPTSLLIRNSNTTGAATVTVAVWGSETPA